MFQTVWHYTKRYFLMARPIRRLWIRSWYNLFFSRYAKSDLRFMNYGYAGPDGEASVPEEQEDKANRYQIQMYHHVAGQIDLRGLDVLEVGSGRGGGAAWVFSHLGPRRMLGVDISAQSVEFCNKQYALPGLSFVQGDAENLNLPAQSFDVVLNIESAHGYRDMGRFLSEVERVLRPGGYFLFADDWRATAVQPLLAMFRAASLDLCKQEDIMPGVLRALELDNARKLEAIQSDFPAFSRPIMREWSITTDSKKYQDYPSGRQAYICCLLRKPETRTLEGGTRGNLGA